MATAHVPSNIRDRHPLRLSIGNQDCSFLLSESFTFSNTDPGGFEAASFPIPHDMPWVERGMNVRLDSGLEVAWEGRVKEIQRSLGSKTLIQCEGYRAVTKENSIRENFVDRDLTKWHGPALGFQKYFLERGYSPTSSTLVYNGSGEPAVSTEVVGDWTESTKPVSIASYHANGLGIGYIHLFWERAGKSINPFDTNWEWYWAFDYTFGDESKEFELERGFNLASEGPGTYDIAPGPDFTFISAQVCILQLRYLVGGGEPNLKYIVNWSKLAVYGKHGLPKRGESPWGFYPSDIVKFCSGSESYLGFNAKGELAFLERDRLPGIQPGIVEEASQFIVPHAVYITPVSVEQVVGEMSKYAGWHWGVWESLQYMTGNAEPRLDFRAYPKPGHPTCWAWRNECEVLDIRESIENLYNTARVSFTEPGQEERQVEAARKNKILEKVGLNRQILLNAGTTTEAAAKVYGEIQLQLLEEQANVTGSATITHPIHNMNGSEKPAWMLRAGLDRLSIPDLPTSLALTERVDLPISRVECSAGSSGITTNVEFGLGPNLIETLQAQIEVETKLATQG